MKIGYMTVTRAVPKVAKVTKKGPDDRTLRKLLILLGVPEGDSNNCYSREGRMHEPKRGPAALPNLLNARDLERLSEVDGHTRAGDHGAPDDWSPLTAEGVRGARDYGIEPSWPAMAEEAALHRARLPAERPQVRLPGSRSDAHRGMNAVCAAATSSRSCEVRVTSTCV